MLRSMTGFGSAGGSVEGVEYGVEMRSVNNRYLKCMVKLPESWSHAEAEIEKLLRERLQRGTVTLTVRMRVPDEQAACHVNTAALSAYLDQIRVLEVDTNPMLRIDLGSLLLLPGVCEPPSLADLCERTKEGLMALIGQALEALVEMRRQEGGALKADLLGNCSAIESNLEAVRARAPAVVVDYQQRLGQRVTELTRAGQVDIDQDQLAREVAIFAERCDIAEEITRLTGHIEQFRQTVTAPEPTGRKLDFIAQEMLREANTIAAKAGDAEIGRAVVDIKTSIDRIKEQVQNVE
jgi:uncharacterized protein (TIGR00255 family)